MNRWRKKSTGKVYEVSTHDASIECSCCPDIEQYFDDDTFTVYQSIDTGAIYARPTPEFLDGRFERLSDDGS